MTTRSLAWPAADSRPAGYWEPKSVSTDGVLSPAAIFG